ncbi:hypothetical protein Tco_0778442 [Tanacetum coccineum]
MVEITAAYIKGTPADIDFGNDLAMKCLATEFKREIYAVISESRDKILCRLNMKLFDVKRTCEGILIPRSRDGAQWLYILMKRMSRWFGAEIDAMRPQVHDGGLGVVAMDEGQGVDKGVPVNEYLVNTLRPEDEGGRIAILLLDRNRCCLNWKKWNLCHHGEQKVPTKEFASSESLIFNDKMVSSNSFDEICNK